MNEMFRRRASGPALHDWQSQRLLFLHIWDTPSSVLPNSRAASAGLVVHSRYHFAFVYCCWRKIGPGAWMFLSRHLVVVVVILEVGYLASHYEVLPRGIGVSYRVLGILAVIGDGPHSRDNFIAASLVRNTRGRLLQLRQQPWF